MSNRINDQEDFSMYYPDGDAANMQRDDNADTFLKQNIKKKKSKKKNSKISKKQITWIALIFVIYALVILVAALMIFHKPAQPPVEEIPFDTTPTDPDDPNNPPLDGDEANNNDPSGLGGGYKARKGIYNILVIGYDDTAHLADVVMLVNCDTNNGSINVMQIPRDTLVTIGLITNKNNEAFSHFYINAQASGSKDKIGDAGKAYAEMLEKSLCINIHNTVVMDLSGFRSIVNAVGGVDVYIPSAMEYEDPYQNLYINIPAGYQHLDGADAEGFIRFRDDYAQADLGRVNAQKIFLTAMFKQVKSVIKNADVSAISSLAGAIFKSVSTDLTVTEIIYYANFLLNVNLEEINMMTVPGDVAGAYYVINRIGALEAVNGYFNIYDKDITDSIFDRDHTFCFVDQQYICDVYFADKLSTGYGEIYNGEKINEGSINIPRT